MPERALVVVPTYNETREPAADRSRRSWRRTPHRDSRRRRRLAGRHRRDGRRSSPRKDPRVHVLHRAAKDRARDGVSRRLHVGARARLRPTSSRWTPISRTTRSTCRAFSTPSRDADLVARLALRQRRQRHQLANEPVAAVVVRQQVRALVTGLQLDRRDRRLQVLSPRGAGSDAARPGALQRLRLPDRDELSRWQKGFRISEIPHRLRGSRWRAAAR